MIGQTPLIGNLLTQPQVPTAAPAPTADKIGLWKKFQQRMEQDPNLRMALLSTGINLLRTPQPGQTGFDVFADAAGTGIGTFDQLNQRDRAQDIEVSEIARQADIDERRTGATESNAASNAARVDIAANNVAVSQDQFDRNFKLAQQKHAEDVRQFNVRRDAGGLTAGGGVTGQERLIASGVQALVTTQPNVYPDTEEGRAKARLVVQGIGGEGGSPQGQARIMSSLISDMQENNPFLPEDQQLDQQEIVRRALETYKLISGDIDAAIEQTTNDSGLPDSIVHPAYGKGRVVQSDNGTVVIEYEDGRTTAPITLEQFQQFQNNLGQQ